MVGSLLIFAREGLEGTLICSILLTCLASAGRRDLFRSVFLGAGAAVVVATAAGIVLWIVSRDAFIKGSTARRPGSRPVSSRSPSACSPT